MNREILQQALDALEAEGHPGWRLLTALREALAAPEPEPVTWQFRWTNPGNKPDVRPHELEWRDVVQTNSMYTIEDAVEDLRGYSFDGKPCYEVRPLYAAPPAAPAPAAPVPDGWVMVPRKELGDGISLLHQAMVGACDCLIKTHEAKYHAESCFYRRLSEQCDKLEATIAASPAAPPAAPVVPLTDEQIRSMWKSSEFRGNGGQVDWFCEGIRAAEAHHGITGGKP